MRKKFVFKRPMRKTEVNLTLLCNGENVIVSLQRLSEIFELLTSEIGLIQRQPLDHRAHGPVENKNSLVELGLK